MRRLIGIVVMMTIANLQILTAQCIKGNCVNGTGTFMYSSGAKYVGTFQNGKMNGDGALYFSNGNKYFGQWKNQYREGKGKMVFTNGDIFRGHFKKSKMNGKGTMEYVNGSRYEGNWIDDQATGKGKFFFADGKIYEGDFLNGNMHGEGTMIYADKSRYVGTWKNNQKDGHGKLIQANGQIVEGVWANDNFLEDNISGSSISQNNSPSAQSNSTSAHPSGKSLRNCNKEDCMSGEGIFTYSDGSRYVGTFKNKYPHGQGTCFYANGDKYVGGWENHAPHGEGIMYYKHGRVLGALWNYGQVVRELESGDEPVGNEYVEVDKNPEVKIWAVVVGVARYKHMPVLKYTDDDAYQVYAFLKSPEGGALPDNQIRVLIDEDATRSNILRTMRNVFLKADENDVVVMYFSGHGLPGAFIPVDFDGFNNKLSHSDIKQIFKESKAKHKLCLADACHSGTLMAMRSAPASFENTLRKYYSAFDNSTGGTALLMSSKGEEYSLEDKGLRQGIFSHYLIRGLKGEADANHNKIVTIQELYDYVFKKVRNYTGNAQSPTLSGEFDPRMPVAVIR
ncbi:MAG TPA: peptidase C14 caspase catalytic subunit p20 [Phaeodactylibacter sp.]|nr:peptidase C14 caspase catalytic subunit p20 [Phaeodactylibacter sp.]